MGVRDEMEARRAKREALRREISILQGKISVAREMVLDLNTLKAGISRTKEQWENQYAVFQSVEINASVMVADVFEGNIAEKLSTEIQETTAKMQLTASQMEYSCTNIASQVTRLQEYIQELYQKMQALYVEMTAL